MREARSGIFDHKFTVQTIKYLLACFIPPRKVLFHIILYIHLHAYVSRLKAAFHTILLSVYLCVWLEVNFRTTIYGPNIKILACMFHSTQKGLVAYYFIYTLACVPVSTKSSISYNTIVPVPARETRSEFSTKNYGPIIGILACMFHSTQGSPVAYYFIYTLACVRVSICSSISYNTIVPVPVREARSGIFDHKFTVQTFKYLLACFIPYRKVLLHIILYIH